jgi:hypothetical protein
MGKFDERALRMRKERIDLFGDKSATMIISRAKRSALSYREAVPKLASQIANANPSALCFDKDCGREVRVLNTFMFLSTNPHAAPMAMTACEVCSKKSNEEIIEIVRADLRSHFNVGPMQAADHVGTEFVERDVSVAAVAGISLAVVGADGDRDCPPALLFAKMLERNALPRFAFAHAGHNNCIHINRQLLLDLTAAGISHEWTFKEGNCPVLKTDGQPIGLHRWAEVAGWAVDASGGAVGNPVLFQRVEDYYGRRQMTDIKEVDQEPGNEAI